MPTLTVRSGDKELRVAFTPGRSLRDILDSTSFRVRSGCRGMGACGLCLVRVESGDAGRATPNEENYLNEAQLAQGIRLACQVIPEQDIEAVILAPAQESDWKSPLISEVRRVPRGPVCLPRDTPRDVKTPCGVAIDLGTTHISLSLHDLSRGVPLARRYGPNPQTRFGSDVITRLMAAAESAKRAQALSHQVVTAIGEGLADIASREGIDLHQVVRLNLVGNTAMLALLTGRNFDLLLQPRHWTSTIDCLPDHTDDWAVAWGIHPQASIQVIPPLAGFVGSDLLAGLLGTAATHDGAGCLLIDFGTNSEIALWDGEALWVTSAAGGPAFEGSGLTCGLPVGPGAIQRVNVLQDGTFHLSVIDGTHIQGICGSGLVDLIANLVRTGRLSTMGRYSSPDLQNGFVLAQGEREITLTKGDVDVFQRAKAAIGAGTEILLAQAGMGHTDLRRICVGGAFGSYLDVANAQTIGLLPAIEPDLVEICGNIALAGCEDALLSQAAGEHLERMRDYARIVNLSNYPDFEDVFLKHLYLQAAN